MAHQWMLPEPKTTWCSLFLVHPQSDLQVYSAAERNNFNRVTNNGDAAVNRWRTRSECNKCVYQELLPKFCLKFFPLTLDLLFCADLCRQDFIELSHFIHCSP